MKKRKITAVFLALMFILLSISGCKSLPAGVPNSEEPESKNQFVLGTTVTLQLYGEYPDDMFEKIFARFRQIEDSMTINKDGSEVMLINLNAGKQAVQVSDDVYEVIKKGVEFSKLSNGKFDITIGPIVKLWNIGTDNARVPSQAEIDEKKPLVDYSKIEMDDSQKSVKLKEEGMMLDLGGIAKGYAADEAIRLLDESGVESAIINIGGNVFAHGKKSDGSDWKIGVQNPFSSRGEYVGIVEVSNKTVVTSGIYERFFEQDGVRYHHILDTHTGYPVENNMAAVSIVAEKSIDADALSTAAFSLGVEDGLKLVEGYEGAEAIFITKDYKIYTTTGLKDVFSITDKSFKAAVQ